LTRPESALADSGLAGNTVPLDPAREWLAAGITGLARGREWDAVVTLAGAGAPGDEVRFVALPDGAIVVESPAHTDAAPFAAALRDGIAPPYRALAVRRPELWAIGAVAIEVGRLDPDPRGDDLQLNRIGAALELTIDGVPADPAQAVALERIAASRVDGPFAAHAQRIRGDLWELTVRAL
jgi:hypothetical protein